MTISREQLEEFIEKNAEKYHGDTYPTREHTYIYGGKLLLDPLLKCVEALEKNAIPFQGIPNESNYEDWKSESVAMKIFANQALASLEEMIKTTKEKV